MVDNHLIVSAKRLANDLRELKISLRRVYRRASQQVTSGELRAKCSTLAEAWLADLSQRPGVTTCVSPEQLGNLSVHFQRLLVCAEHATVRRRYDKEIKSILRNFTTEVVVPLMQGPPKPQRDGTGRAALGTTDTEESSTENFIATAFVAHSFATVDTPIVDTITGILEAIGIKVFTGERPKADRISEKVKKLIDEQHLFVGVFTRRHRLVGRKGWNTSEWVIDEKAYAYGKNKKLILLKESGVESIGGIQGDYEFIEFQREKLEHALLQLLRLFALTVHGLQK